MKKKKDDEVSPYTFAGLMLVMFVLIILFVVWVGQ